MTQNRKDFLREIAIIRPITIVLLVLYHAFASYDGRWLPFEGITECETYKWIARLNGFVPAMFFFISGYVCSSQILVHDKSYWDILKKKFRRLIIPSIIFSVIYLTIFDRDNIHNILQGFLSVLSGVGHIWFLPVLFLCFVTGLPLIRMKWAYGETGKVILLCILALCGWGGMALHLPFGFNRLFTFLIYFYLGYVVYLHKDTIIRKFVEKNCIFYLNLVLLIVIIPFFFVAKNYNLSDAFSEIEGVRFRILQHTLSSAVVLVLNVAQITLIYMIVMKILSSLDLTIISSWLIVVNIFCFGIYIYHQFVLKILYYYTDFPQMLNGYLLPWIAVALTLFISSLLTFMTLRIKVGRLLIG